MEKIKIQRLTFCDESDFNSLKVLMKQLSPRLDLSRERLDSVLSDDNVRLYVIREEDGIIGCAELCIYESLSSRKGVVEEVAVLETHRGRGLGRTLMEFLLSEARSEAPIDLFLTSNQSRLAANALYSSIGFVPKSTNCYKLNI